MADRTGIIGGCALILGGIGEMVATRSVCPLCIASVTGGIAMLGNSVK